MDFRTEIKPGHAPFGIGHSDRVFMAGSCFSENILRRMEAAKFRVAGNPTGVLFNPASIAGMIGDLTGRRVYTGADIVSGDGIWFGWSHHGSFSGADPDSVLEGMNAAAEKGADALEAAKYVVITFGTAWIFRLAATGAVAANCHKMPAGTFLRERLTTADIVRQYSELLEGPLKNRTVIFSVSPVRHLKDGFEGNSLSKAILRTAIGELTEKYHDAHYFPAYETVIDDLRDYRFYADDMVHPSAAAVEYIWEKFAEWALDGRALALLPRLEKLSAAMNHRVMNPEAGGGAVFARNMLALTDELAALLPDSDFTAERTRFSVVHSTENRKPE